MSRFPSAWQAGLNGSREDRRAERIEAETGCTDGITRMTEPRFYIDHGMIHDRKTGKHVTTEPDSPFCDGIVKCCELLNELVQREPRTFPLLVSAERLAEQIAADPDIECEAGPDLSEKPLSFYSQRAMATDLANSIDHALALVPQSANGVDLAAADMLFMAPQISDFLRQIACLPPYPRT